MYKVKQSDIKISKMLSFFHFDSQTLGGGGIPWVTQFYSTYKLYTVLDIISKFLYGFFLFVSFRQDDVIIIFWFYLDFLHDGKISPNEPKFIFIY